MAYHDDVGSGDTCMLEGCAVKEVQKGFEFQETMPQRDSEQKKVSQIRRPWDLS
jgi:hypothetical protein